MNEPLRSDSTGDPESGGERLGPLRRLGRSAMSLRGQIALLVLLATGVTALLAAWTSTATIERYLGKRIAERFPALLSAKERELDAWYRQARLNLDTFARSETLIRNVPLIGTDDEAVAREELQIYLAYVQQRFERFPALYLLDANGDTVLRTGHDMSLPESVRKAAPGLDKPVVHDVVRLGGQRLQVASAPVRDAGGATLHALIDLESMDAMLGEGVQRDATHVYVIDSLGHYIAGTLDRVADDFAYRGPGGGAGDVRTYVNGHGERVIGGARSAERHGWTLVVEQDYEAAFEPVGALVRRVVWADLAIGLVLVLVAGRLAMSVVRPVGALSAAAQRVAAGETGLRLDEPRGAIELVNLTRAFNQMTANLDSQRLELQRRNEELQQLSVTDDLTGAFNHRYFRDRLPLEIKRAQRSERLLALLVFDIDDFKAINDGRGHAVGDEVLVAIAQTLGGELRAPDMLARYGGEEFVVVSQQPDVEGAVQLAHRMRRAVAALEWPLDADDRLPATVLRATISVGVALHAGDAEDLFHRADAALYQAKRDGKNRVAIAATDDEGPRVVEPPG